MSKKQENKVNILSSVVSPAVVRSLPSPTSTNNVLHTTTGNIVAGGRIHQYWEKNPYQLKLYTKNNYPLKNYLAYTDASSFVEHFNLHSVEFGNWMSQADRGQFMFAAADGLHQLAVTLGLQDSQIGLNRKLSIALGARGSGKAAAHYESAPYAIINITKPHVENGSLAHEYAHAIDNLLAISVIKDKNESYVSGGRDIEIAIDVNRLKSSNFYISQIEKIFQKLYFENLEDKTKFAEILEKDYEEKQGYYKRRAEVWARTFENWLCWRNTDLSDNRMLVKPISVYKKNDIYPDKIIELIDKNIYQFMRSAIRELSEIPFETVKIPVIDTKPVEPKTEVVEPKTEEPKPIPVMPKPEKKVKPKTEFVKRNAENLTYGKDIEIVTPSETLQSKFAIAELDFVQASNDPFTFEKNAVYPASCQTRNYKEDEGDKLKVINHSDKFKYEHLLNNSPDATTGSPIITPDGYVLGGNGRTMIIKRVEAYHKDKFDEYVTALKAISPFLFGISQEEIEKFEKPVLVRVVNVDLAKCATYSNILNKSNMQEYDENREGIAAANQLLEKRETLETIVSLFEDSEGETFSELLDTVAISEGLINALQRADIINPTNMNVLIENKNEFTSKGKSFIESMFLGLILPNKTLIKTAKVYTLKILKAIPDLIRIKVLPNDYNIIPKIQDAIAMESSRKSSKMTVKNFLTQQYIYEGTAPEAITTEIYKILNGTNQKEFRQFLNFYADSASLNSNNDDIFGDKVYPIDIVAAWLNKNPVTLKGLINPDFNFMIERHIYWIFQPKTVKVSFANEFINIYDTEDQLIGRIDTEKMRPATYDFDMFGTTEYNKKDDEKFISILNYIKSLKPSKLINRNQNSIFDSEEQLNKPVFHEPKSPKPTITQTRMKQVRLFDKTGLAFAAHHGSPHRFDKFTTAKIGAGEGAQFFGWGLYFTERKDIAEWYAEKLKFKTGEKNLYKVNIYGNKSEKDLVFLDWDNPIPEKVIELIINQAKKEHLSISTYEYVHNGIPLLKINKQPFSPTSGQNLYMNLLKKIGGSKLFKSAKELSLFLMRAGIAGVKYATGDTRKKATAKSYNYVIFDENAVEIESRNDKKVKPQVIYEQQQLLDRPEDYSGNSLLNDEIDAEFESYDNGEINEVTASDDFMNNGEFMNDDIQESQETVPVIETKRLNLKGKVKQLLGELYTPFSMLIWGKQGSGKSSLALLLADDLSYYGKVLYFANEEKTYTQRIARRAMRLGVNINRFKINDSGNLEEFISELNTGQYAFVIADSKDNFGNAESELMQIRNEFPEISFVYISHSTKDGKVYVGDRKFAYLTDVEITVVDGWAETLKHRDSRNGNKVNILRNSTNKYRSIYK